MASFNRGAWINKLIKFGVIGWFQERALWSQVLVPREHGAASGSMKAANAPLIFLLGTSCALEPDPMAGQAGVDRPKHSTHALLRDPSINLPDVLFRASYRCKCWCRFIIFSYQGAELPEALSRTCYKIGSVGRVQAVWCPLAVAVSRCWRGKLVPLIDIME